MLFAEYPVDRNRFLFLQDGQLGFFFLLDVVGIFQVHRHEAGENQDLAGGAEQSVGVPGRDIDAGGVVPGWRHLAGDRALPDHLVERGLVRRQVSLRTESGVRNDRCRPDRLVRFLGVLGLAAVLDRCLGQVVRSRTSSWM